MWPFRRKNNQDKLNPVPEEIKAYYEAETKDKMWKIWLLSAATFVGTLIVVLLLFWGGRWTWRHFMADQKSGSSSQSQSASNKKTEQKSDKNNSDRSQAEGTNNSNQPTTGQAPTAPTEVTGGATTGGTGTTNDNGANNSSNSQLIDTGPGNVDL